MSAEALILQSEQEELIYPREPGDQDAVLCKDWVDAPPFGYCPACGSVGMEEAPCEDSGYAIFLCSDPTCLTTHLEVPNPPGTSAEGVNHTYRTQWAHIKPPEWRRKEKAGISWNLEHFPLEVRREHNLV